jgi:hypothetical protein
LAVGCHGWLVQQCCIAGKLFLDSSLVEFRLAVDELIFVRAGVQQILPTVAIECILSKT